jgi:tRNA threonylcarbamoyladenosine modification (KEOPS) complex  Pcc1 subunit
MRYTVEIDARIRRTKGPDPLSKADDPSRAVFREDQTQQLTLEVEARDARAAKAKVERALDWLIDAPNWVGSGG